ncbi:TolC family protein [Cerasicoccus fimbriatus]|uniref:TolC family protein n=1 Tax=Cerasicoccus fimbriatus TaxID=3014554 RepID=UPI0022B5036C|nr:TolC family protein [Cerasicoccus sp. TK19100]
MSRFFLPAFSAYFERFSSYLVNQAAGIIRVQQSGLSMATMRIAQSNHNPKRQNWIKITPALFVSFCACNAAFADDPLKPETLPETPMESETTGADFSSDFGRAALDAWNESPQSYPDYVEGLEADYDILELVRQSPLVMDIDADIAPMHLTLRQSVDLALEKNLGLSITRYSPGISLDAITVAEASFDPTINASLTAGEDAFPPSTSLAGVISGRAVNADQQFNVSVDKRFSLGTEVSVGTRLNRATTNSSNALLNPDFSSRLGVTLRQPLLAGFGEAVNLASVTRAQIGLRASRLEVRREVLDLIADVEIAYWNLAAARQRQALFLSNLRLAKSLLEENTERERVGLATRLEVLQAEASLAARSEDVILAQEAADNAEDRLRSVLGILYSERLNPIDVEPLPDNDPMLPEFRDSVTGALASDMESQIQLELIDQLEVDRRVANNSTLPDLDLFAGGGVLGREQSATDSYQSAFESRGYDWNVGLEFSMPWGMRAEEARLRTSTRNIYRAETRLAEIQQELMRRLRLAWRSIASGRERLATTRASLRLNMESFEQERARYDAGLSNFRNVLEAQRDYDDAKLRHLAALYDLREAVVLLARLDGRLLSRHGFDWQEIDNETQTPPDPVKPLSQDRWPAPEFNTFNHEPATLPASYGQSPNALSETYEGALTEQ